MYIDTDIDINIDIDTDTDTNINIDRCYLHSKINSHLAL